MLLICVSMSNKRSVLRDTDNEPLMLMSLLRETDGMSVLHNHFEWLMGLFTVQRFGKINLDPKNKWVTLFAKILKTNQHRKICFYESRSSPVIYSCIVYISSRNILYLRIKGKVTVIIEVIVIEYTVDSIFQLQDKVPKWCGVP